MATARRARAYKRKPEQVSGVRHTAPMLPIVANQKMPTRSIELATHALLQARRKLAGVFADDQPTLFPELEEEPRIPADKAEAIVREAERNIDSDENIGFRVEDGKVKIVPMPKSPNQWVEAGYEPK